MKHEGIEYALLCVIMIVLIAGFAVLVVLLKQPERETKLPEPEYVSRDDAILMHADAPEMAATGLVTYITFEEALEAARADVPEDMVQLVGRAIWGEAGGLTREERAAVVWCACNRADAWGQTLEEVLVPSQFHGLAIAGDVPEEHLDVARDVLARWSLEHDGWVDVGRVLPSQYLFFEGDGQHNYFSTEYGGGEYWQEW